MIRNDIVNIARSWIGTPYRHQASLKHIGCDCLGLVRGVWRELIGSEPETPPAYSADWAEAGNRETLAEAAQRHLIKIPTHRYDCGDVILFRWKAYLPAKHIAIVSAPENMIHAQDNACVSEVALSAWWKAHIAYVFKFPGV